MPLKKKISGLFSKNFKTFVNFEFATNCKMVLINDDQCQIADLVIWSVAWCKNIESPYCKLNIFKKWSTLFTILQSTIVNTYKSWAFYQSKNTFYFTQLKHQERISSNLWQQGTLKIQERAYGLYDEQRALVASKKEVKEKLCNWHFNVWNTIKSRR